MRILVFQHLDIEHPGIFLEFLKEDGVHWDTVELDEGDPIPPLEGYDALWVMGGPMDVWEEDLHPWLKPEKRAIREAVLEHRMPYLGICLGHQLLADALGGKVGKMPQPEVGVMKIKYADAAAADPLFAGMASPATCLQWHGAAVLQPPAGAVVLAHSPLCAVQAMRVNDHAYGVQYHLEITARTVSEWSSISAYEDALVKSMGPGAGERLAAQTMQALPQLNRDARQVYERFMVLARKRQA
ncbi:MAG TPA: type 1 glutamine amidotransferase [Gammaproteobacteria bacterium]|nr:type 1 glutamine amidotransferase [Gammaproteobacteria bacterium]